MNSIESLSKIVAAPEPPAGWFRYAYGLLLNGTLALVQTDRDVLGEQARWSSKLWETRARLSTFDGITESEAIEVPLGVAPKFDRLADGRWLVTCASSAAGDERNARLYASDGTPAGAFAISNGIEHVRCAADGTIWVGYFDGGVFAGPNEDGSWPMSSSGIVRLSSNGEVLWRFNTAERAGLSVVSCYAMSLDGDTLWTSFHRGFPIVRVELGIVRYWPNSIVGARALATDGAHVLLAGGYGDKAGRITLLRLDEDQAVQIGYLDLQPLIPGDVGLVQGQGATLHIVRQGRWQQLALSAALAALGA